MSQRYNEREEGNTGAVSNREVIERERQPTKEREREAPSKEGNVRERQRVRRNERDGERGGRERGRERWRLT